MRGGDNYLTKGKLSILVFSFKFFLQFGLLVFLKLSRRMLKAWILNSLLMFALGFFRYAKVGE